MSRSSVRVFLVATFWMYICTPAFSQSISFLPRQDYTVGDDPRSAAFGDFNSDGRLDMVVANDAGSGTGASPTLSVLLGNGRGAFTLGSTIPTSDLPYYIRSADFNGDGRDDLVVAHVDSSKLSVLLGNGNGTFRTALTVPTIGKPFSVVAARINSDNIFDLVVGSYAPSSGPGSGHVQVLSGNGDGTFSSTGTWSPADSSVFYVAAADFNRDSIPDVAASMGGSVGVLFGNGDGTLRVGPVISGGGARGIVAADFNGDGNPDFVSTSFDLNPAHVEVVLGNGNGTFQAPVSFPTGQYQWGMAGTDFNADGNFDLVTANYGSNTISVLAGNGNGTFQAPVNFATGNTPYFAGISDFNGDGMPDMAVTNSGSNSLSILMNNLPPPGSIWATPVNAIAGLNSLTKFGGCDGCYDAGAATKAAVQSGDVFADFRFSNTTELARAGFAHAFTVTDGHSEDFAIRLQNGFAEVREFGIFRADVAAAPGAMFRIAIRGGVVTYAQNGSVFYTSSTPVQYPLVFTAILGTANSSIDSVVLSTPPAGGSGNGPQPATWISMANVTFSGNTVSKPRGFYACYDAFVATAATIVANGYAEFTVDKATAFLLAGFARNLVPGDGRSIDFGIRVQSGYAEVLENGVHRGGIETAAGSVFRISLSNGTVSYSKDGFVFYSGPASAGPFAFAALFANFDASVSNVVIANGP